MVSSLISRIGKIGRPALAGLAVLGLILGSTLQAPPAMAQDTGLRPWLRNLFTPRRSQRVEPPAETMQKNRAKTGSQNSRKKTATRSEPAVAPVPVVEKAADARVVLVVGDFMASGLADGLATVFAENPAVRVVDRSNGSSGLVRNDYYDWPGEIGAIMETEKPAVVLVMMGSNDRQQMKVGESRAAPRTDGWLEEYRKRAAAFGKRIKDARHPFLWVGMPSFRPGSMTSDMLALNEIYRDAAPAAGGEFVDIWEGFVDENGAFVSRGPDINGQPATLRSEDGINMTRAGKRKIAFYTEKPLLKLLGLASPGAAVTDIAPLAPAPDTPAAPQAPLDRTPPMLLSDPALDGGTELLGATLPARDGAARQARDKSEPAAPPGRADDFSGPTQRKANMAASGDRTGSVNGAAK